ncbi:MAG: hypothetical protein GTO22_16150, partial [Gemmatimonadales bacterium]|nr:hypothetical protein [Gemmatimonadales bacterium]
MGLKNATYYLEKLQSSIGFLSLPQDHVYTYLLRASDLAFDMSVDGSGTPQNFDYTVPAGTSYRRFQIARLNIMMLDNTIRWDQFLGVGGELTNGMLFQVLDDTGAVMQDFGTGVSPMKKTADFTALAGVDTVRALAVGDDMFPVRWTILKSGNKMTLYPNWKFRCVVRDDLSSISEIKMQ